MIALVLGGMYREFDSTYKLIKDTIPQSTDIYFSTWNNSYDIFDDGVNKLEVKDEAVTEELIHSFNKDIKCLIKDEALSGDSHYVFYHWITAFKEFDLSNYDCVIVSRPDQYIDYNEAYGQFKDNNTIYGLRTGRFVASRGGINDRLLMGTYNNIKIVLNKIEASGYGGSHRLLKDTIIGSNIGLEELKGKQAMIRVNTRLLRESDKTIDNLIKKEIEYLNNNSLAVPTQYKTLI